MHTEVNSGRVQFAEKSGRDFQGAHFNGVKKMSLENPKEVHIPDIAPATAEEFLDLGMKYCLGRGVLKNNVLAHMWLNIAAMKGSEPARHYRHELAQEMSQPEIAAAQREARTWLTLH